MLVLNEQFSSFCVRIQMLQHLYNIENWFEMTWIISFISSVVANLKPLLEPPPPKKKLAIFTLKVKPVVYKSHVIQPWQSSEDEASMSLSWMSACSFETIPLHLVKITASDGPNKRASATECTNSVVVTCFFIYIRGCLYAHKNSFISSSLPCSLSLSAPPPLLCVSAFTFPALKAGLFHVM